MMSTDEVKMLMSTKKTFRLMRFLFLLTSYLAAPNPKPIPLMVAPTLWFVLLTVRQGHRVCELGQNVFDVEQHR